MPEPDCGEMGVIMKIGIIGTGIIAVTGHIPAYVELGHEIIAVADIAPGRAEKFSKEWRIPYFFEDYKELLSLTEIEAVSICVPTYLHEQVAVDAMNAGKHVFLEKPPAFDEAGIRHIYETAQKTGRILLVGSNTVYHNQYQIAKEFVDSGRLGEVYSVKINRTQRREIPGGWLARKDLSRGFAITEGVTHNLDCILFMLGEPKPVSVTCVTYNMFSNYVPETYKYPIDAVESQKEDKPKETEDGVVALITLEGGRTILVECFRASNAEKSYNIMLYGDKAGLKLDLKQIYWENKEGGLTLYEEPQHGVFTEAELEFKSGKRNHVNAISHFIDCVKRGEQTLSNGERAITIMKIIDAMFLSAEQHGRQVIL